MNTNLRNTVLVIALLAVLGVAYIVMSKDTQESVIPEQNSSVDSTENDDLAGSSQLADSDTWVTYKPKTLPYEFQYPENWIFNAAEESESDPHLSNMDFIGDTAAEGQVTIEVQPNSTKPANTDLLTYMKETANKDGVGIGHTCPCVSTMVNGVSVVKMTNHGGEGPAGPGYAIAHPTDPTKYAYFFVYGIHEVETVNKVIASFKYTN